MNTAIIAELEEQRRDALVDYYLGQIIPSAETSAPPTIITPEDLYEYLLIDNQVNAQVDTSRVAQAIASIQQYIHAIFNGMEPGYPDGFDTEYLQLWREGISEYSVWAGYQMIEDYPENYIDPALRLIKSEQFQELEMDLEQSRITPDSVQMALMSYLNKFEIVSNLKIVSGFIDLNEKSDFRHADYYFIGRQNVEPFSHYWRKAAISVKDDTDHVSPTAWSEWKAIDVASTPGSLVRAVVLDGRLYAIWAESGQRLVDENGKQLDRYSFYIKMSFKQLNGMWSPATTLYEGTAKHAYIGLDSGYVFYATVDARLDEPRLVFCFYEKNTGGQSDALVVKTYDKLFHEFPLDSDEQKALKELLFTGSGADPARLQNPFYGALEGDGSTGWTLESVAWDKNSSYNKDGQLQSSILVSALLHTDPATKDKYLNVEGLCKAVLNDSKIERFFLTLKSWSDGYSGAVLKNVGAWCEGGADGKVYGVIVANLRSDTGQVASFNWTFNGRDVLNGSTNMFYSKANTHLGVGYSSEYRWQLLGVTMADFENMTDSQIAAGAGISMVMRFGGEMRGGLLSHSTNHASRRTTSVSRVFALTHIRMNAGALEKLPLGSWNLPLNGNASTGVIRCPLPDILTASSYLVFGNSDSRVGEVAFAVTLSAPATTGPQVVTTEERAQFLDLASLKLNTLRYVRLNTLIAKQLVKKAEFSVEGALSWASQHTPEPPSPDVIDRSLQNWPTLDFFGANSRYFWEIFFHVPHLVAHRLHTEFDYPAAQNWLNYIFNPLVRIPPLNPPLPDTNYPYWVSRPLTLADTQYSFELDGVGDPDAIAYSTPSHYRKTIFMAYLNNVIALGDMLYRRLTRDTLNEAKLHYVRALSLLGPLLKGRSISKWEPVTLEAAANTTSAVISDFAVSVWNDQAINVTDKAKGQPWLRLLGADGFRLPVNQVLLDVWERLESRLSNLRNNLSLDGKPLELALFEQPANPTDLLRAQLAGAGSAQRRLGSLAIIPPYRFRAMLPRVQNAVETLIRYGDQVRSYMDMRDRSNQDELQQSHFLELSGFTKTLQELALDQSKASRSALDASCATLTARKNFYEALIKEDVSLVEFRATEKQRSAKHREEQARVDEATGHKISATVPSIFGLAQGGVNTGGYYAAIATTKQARVQTNLFDIERTLVAEQYRRRRVDWEFQVDQTSLEIASIKQQIAVQDIATDAALASLAQASKAQQQALEYYSFLKNRATGPALYQWLLSQMATMYFQAYDVVLSMCLSAEACWQYEIGDRDTHFVPTNAWTDNYHGLTAGEALKLGLLRMESAYLNRHERRLELTKTVSLRKLFELKTKDAPEGVKWEQVLKTFLGSEGTGTLPFNLTALAFDQDYPGHYLRQLVNVSVSIPAVIGPYQDIRATLTQLGSRTLMKPDIDGVKSLYLSDNTLPEGEQDNADGTQVMSNPRAYQQIGISHGVDDRGLFNMDFGDERYYPFEGTGAVSSWQLHFPRHTSPEQAAMLASLTDIIVHVRYLAVDGGIPFHNQVEALMDQVEKPPTAPAAKKRATAAKKKRH